MQACIQCDKKMDEVDPEHGAVSCREDLMLHLLRKGDGLPCVGHDGSESEQVRGDRAEGWGDGARHNSGESEGTRGDDGVGNLNVEQRKGKRD